LLSTPSAKDVYGHSQIISYEREVGEDKEGDGNAPADLPRLQNMLHKNRRTYCVCRDTRTAFDELPSNLKEQLLKNDHIADNSTWYFLQLAVLDLLDLLDLLDFLAHINPPASPDGLTSPRAAPRSLGQDEPLYCGSRTAH
jgi:hypothetical protein